MRHPPGPVRGIENNEEMKTLQETLVEKCGPFFGKTVCHGFPRGRM